MKLLKYSNVWEKKINGNSDLYIVAFTKRLQEKLKNIEAKSEIQNGTIAFKRVVRNTTHLGINKIEALKILREGFVRIEKVDSNKVQIFLEVKLDVILFLSFLIGLFIGLITAFAGSSFSLSIIIGLLFSIVTYLIGCSIIQRKIDEIVSSSM